jgi:regulator of cell morphogenesis and NO signaling
VQLDPTMTLGALVNAHPELARQFEQRGLDYCCGGRQSLADACASQGLDSAMVANELTVAAAGEDVSDWSTMSAVELVDHVVATHHRYLWDEMPRLSALVAKIVSVHRQRHRARGHCRVLPPRCADLEPHMLKRRVLFR